MNVTDKPAYCQFQFGSIVNRSPVVIGISTDGAAPILGQAIRRRIETLLPTSLAVWGRLAKEVRDRVGSRLSPDQQRRSFWDAFAERAFGPPPRADAATDLTRLIDDIASVGGPTNGRVTLVGAGPGDAELLTLKAVRRLGSGDFGGRCDGRRPRGRAALGRRPRIAGRPHDRRERPSRFDCDRTRAVARCQRIEYGRTPGRTPVCRHCICCPPLMAILAPVTKAASSEHR